MFISCMLRALITLKKKTHFIHMNLIVCDFCVCVWILNTRTVGVSLWWELVAWELVARSF